MSSVQHLREFISARLTAAAEEIFTEFEKTIEEELDGQRRLLDISWKPVRKLQKRNVRRQHAATQQLFTLEDRSNLDQEEPEPPRTEEDQEEVHMSQDREQLVLKDETHMVVQIQPEPEELFRVCKTSSIQEPDHQSRWQNVTMPQIKLHRIHIQQQQMSSSLNQEEPEPPQTEEDQEEPEPPRTEEDQEEVHMSQDREQLVLKDETHMVVQIQPEPEELFRVCKTSSVQEPDHQSRWRNLITMPQIKLHRIHVPQQHGGQDKDVPPSQQPFTLENSSSVDQEEPEHPQTPEEQLEPGPTQMEQDQEELEPLQMEEDQVELEPPQREEDQEKLEPPQMEQDQEELKTPQMKEDPEELEHPLKEEDREKLEPPQMQEDQEKLEPLQMEQDQEKLEPLQMEQDQEKLEPSQTEEVQEELEPPQMKDPEKLEPPQMKEDPEELKPPQMKEDPEELEPPQMEQDQEELEPPQMEQDQEELEPPQMEQDQEELEPPQMEQDQEELEPPQMEQDQEKLEPLQMEEDEGNLEPSQTKEVQEELEPPQTEEDQEELEPPQTEEDQEELEPPQTEEDQEELEPLQMDEDQEEVHMSQDREQLVLKDETHMVVHIQPEPEELFRVCKTSSVQEPDHQSRWQNVTMPQIKLHRIHASHQHVCRKIREEEEEMNCSMDQDEPEPQQIHQPTNQEGDQLVLNQDAETPMNEDSDHIQPEANSNQLVPHGSPPAEHHVHEATRDVLSEQKMDIHCENDKSGTSVNGDVPKSERKKRGKKPFLCNVCRKRFRSCSGLAVHMRSHAAQKQCSCETCGESFTCSSALTVHMTAHTGDETYSCSTCSKTFSNKTHLTSHLRTHAAEKKEG